MNKPRNRLVSFQTLALAALVLMAPLPSPGATLNLPSTFNGGTSEGWVTNDGSILLNAGQGGVGDHVLEYVSNGGEGFFPQNASLASMTGDYEAAGALAFEFDAKFISGSSLSLRVYMLDVTPAGTVNDYFALSNSAVNLSSLNTDWNHYIVSIDPADVTAVRTAFPRSHVQIVGLRHDPGGEGPTFSDPVVLTTTVQFDNFVLTAAPEPSVILLGAFGLVTTLLVRRRANG